MGNEANHVTDGLTVIGSLALATPGDADAATLNANTDGALLLNGRRQYERIRRALPNKGGMTIERFGTTVNDLVQSGHGWTATGNTNSIPVRTVGDVLQV